MQAYLNDGKKKAFASMETNADARKKSNMRYGHVELPEITPSISDKSACSRTEEKVIKKFKMRNIHMKKR